MPLRVEHTLYSILQITQNRLSQTSSPQLIHTIPCTWRGQLSHSLVLFHSSPAPCNLCQRPIHSSKIFQKAIYPLHSDTADPFHQFHELSPSGVQCLSIWSCLLKSQARTSSFRMGLWAGNLSQKRIVNLVDTYVYKPSAKFLSLLLMELGNMVLPCYFGIINEVKPTFRCFRG